MVPAPRKRNWVWAAIIVTTVQFAAIVTIFSINIDPTTLLGNCEYYFLNLLSFQPGRLVLLALRGPYPGGGSIAYYAESAAITWLVYTASLHAFLTRGQHNYSSSDQHEPEVPHRSIFTSAIKRAWLMIVFCDLFFVLFWRVVSGPHLDWSSWIAVTCSLLLLDGAMVRGGYNRERSRRRRQTEQVAQPTQGGSPATQP